ncbi:MDR family MFS transporter [Clostridium sp. WILCCON 0269]|uniref:MDR family MFS transporter n=1 Tax=Candidatus Clostridium eludens TaxID=3381663 RepID=A0ABW8SLB0_9CLOT
MELEKRNIVIASMVAMFLAAVEGTVVITAVPTIVKNLNGFYLMSWVFSTYLLTSTVTTPIYGKLADLYGRKNTLTLGIVIFLAGSFLCGLSQNMYFLIMSRAIQGIGAGSIFTLTYTIIGDVFSVSGRAKVQGWLSTVWGAASLIGPFLGGFLIDTLSWHWIFFINIPFGIISVILIQKNLKENFEKRDVHIDYLGIIILTISIVLLLYGFLAGGNKESVFFVLICVLVSFIFLSIFYFVEKRAKEPIIPFEIFTKANVIVNTISFLQSAVLIAIDVYIVLYMQNVLGFGATISGLCMAPMSLAWLMSSIFLGKYITKYSKKNIVLVSSFIVLLGSVLLPALNMNSSLILVILSVLILGFGFGGNTTTQTIVIQTSVDYFMRGVAVASNTLLRNLGQTIGISVFGSIFNLSIIRYFQNLGINGIEPSNLYNTQVLNNNISAELVKESLNSGLHLLFLCFIIVNIVSLILCLFLPKRFKGEQLDV